MSHDPQQFIARKVALARLAEGFEQLWAAAFPLLVTVMAGLIVALSGLIGVLPHWGRYGLAVLFLVALAAALKPLYGVCWPSREDALRRIERTSHLSHRPLATLADEIADPAASPETRRLWAEHHARLLAGLKRLRAGPPRSHLPARDPYALRNALAIGLIAVLALGGWNWRDRLAGTFHDGKPAAGVITSVDAWITPPAYTRKPPVLLSAAARPDDAGDITVPEGWCWWCASMAPPRLPWYSPSPTRTARRVRSFPAGPQEERNRRRLRDARRPRPPGERYRQQ